MSLIDISPLYKYDVSGRDVLKFVNRVVTRDAAKCALGQAMYTCLCDAQGKVIQDGEFFNGAFEPLVFLNKIQIVRVEVPTEEELPEEPASQAAQIQKASYVPQGWQMERYKAFFRQAELPPITVADGSQIEVGGTVKLDMARPGQSTSQQRQSLASQLGVPAGVIGTLLQRLASGAKPGADECVRELRRAVVDYRFLKQEWERYNPPAEGRANQQEALAALEAGDVTRAWQLYDGLRRPQAPALGAPAPPTNLRAVAGP